MSNRIQTARQAKMNKEKSPSGWGFVTPKPQPKTNFKFQISVLKSRQYIEIIGVLSLALRLQPLVELGMRLAKYPDGRSMYEYHKCKKVADRTRYSAGVHPSTGMP
jgi:hypothetical protein